MPRKKKLTGLPEVEDQSVEARKHAKRLDDATFCSKCGEPGRVVSNNNGINVFCGPCKIHWPISATPLVPVAVPVQERGLKKTTLVEPDWSRALEDD